MSELNVLLCLFPAQLHRLSIDYNEIAKIAPYELSLPIHEHKYYLKILMTNVELFVHQLSLLHFT